MSTSSGSQPQVTSSAPSPGGGGGTDSTFPGPGAGNPKLYIYTFLSTVVVLTVATAFLVLRTHLARRRIQRAIANGTFVAPGQPGNAKPVTLLRRPKMYDVYVDEKADGKGCWEALHPVAALDTSLLYTKPPGPVESPSNHADQSPPSRRPFTLRTLLRPIRAVRESQLPDSFSPRSDDHSPPAEAEMSNPASPSSPPSPPAQLCVAVLVHMPDSLAGCNNACDARRNAKGDDNEDLPCYEMGFVDARVLRPMQVD